MAKARDKEEKVYVSCASVSPSSIHTFVRPINGYQYTSKFTDNIKNLEDNEHDGVVSYKARKKIAKALDWLLFKAQPKKLPNDRTASKVTFRINFITLTLSAPQQHEDIEITARCLNNFLTKIRSIEGISYLWRAEAQPMTGNIHYHVTTDKFIHYDTIRKWWNQSQELLGYVSEFEKKFHHNNPNSTDVHAIKHIHKLAAYLSKYLCKNRRFAPIGELRIIEGELKEIAYKSDTYREEKPNRKKGKIVGHMLSKEIRPIKCRLWGCSSDLSKAKNLFIDGELHDTQIFQEFITQSDFTEYQGAYVYSHYGDVAGEAEKYFPQLFEALKLQIN